ncbi:hypothetical protein IHE44_0007209 [Lamprotornis superbus]|uniref:Uncharacterized protein n=1 Tax=Lamprotornis superbus TaxID=245042 RepID=A0A835NVX5_9PASS|nr:hypothetical protein IHE44_0007209 [Lamprotornis superbus]
MDEVLCYKDHHCYNSRDRHVLNMFISICNDLRNLCQKLEKVHPGDRVSNDLLEKCKVLLNDSNDFTALRATYPHGVVNYLSLAEATDCYAGVVSLIPIVIDTVREWITYTNKNLLPNVQCYKDHHCYNSTDRRILNMFISICNDLRNLCQKLEKVHPGDSVTKGLVEKCKVLLNDSNDFTALRATQLWQGQRSRETPHTDSAGFGCGTPAPLRVQCYKDHHCYNSTDRRILNMFISICNDLRNLCQKLEKVHPGDSVTKGLVEKCKVLLNDSNDFTALRATYPHGVVNYLSLEEAKNRYGGVVSLIPIVIDTVREWITYTNKNLLPNGKVSIRLGQMSHLRGRPMMARGLKIWSMRKLLELGSEPTVSGTVVEGSSNTDVSQRLLSLWFWGFSGVESSLLLPPLLLLLPREEVVLFCKLRFQFSYPFLGSIKPLALLLNTRLCFLQFFPKSSVQHFNLLEANNTMVQLIDLPKNQQLPVQELHLLLHRFTVGKLGREMEQNPFLLNWDEQFSRTVTADRHCVHKLQTSDIHNTNTDLNEVTNEASLLIEWQQKTPGRPINTRSSTSMSQSVVELSLLTMAALCSSRAVALMTLRRSRRLRSACCCLLKRSYSSWLCSRSSWFLRRYLQTTTHLKTLRDHLRSKEMRKAFLTEGTDFNNCFIKCSTPDKGTSSEVTKAGKT